MPPWWVRSIVVAGQTACNRQTVPATYFHACTPSRAGGEMLAEERNHVAVEHRHRVRLVLVVVAVPQHALDLERVELLLERLAELRVVDALPRPDVRGQR